MSTWTMNIQAQKKDLLSAVDLEVSRTEGQRFYDGEAKVVKPIIQAILDNYSIANDQVPVTVNVSSGGVSGRVGLSLNVNW